MTDREKTELELALRWFKNNDIPAFEDGGSIYLPINNETDIQISTAEIAYRAELQKEDEATTTNLNQ